MDNGSIHKSKLTRRWLANHPRFQVLYLPAYSGHDTNPVEKVWWALKAECAANQMYPSREAVQEAIHAFFSKFAREAAPGMLVLGPGSVGEGGARIVPESVPTLSTEAMLSAEPHPVCDAFSFHYYGAVSLRCAAMGTMLGATKSILKELRNEFNRPATHS